MAFSITTLNIHGMKSATRAGFWSWFTSHKVEENMVDVLCLQEMRCGQLEIPPQIPHHLLGRISPKVGHYGVGMLSKRSIWNKSSAMSDSLLHPELGVEGRLMKVQIEGVNIVNLYAPSLLNQHKQSEAEQFWAYVLANAQHWITEPTILCGDFNLIAAPLDVHPSLVNSRKKILSRQFEIMQQFWNMGWMDAFRHLHPQKQEYSYWKADMPHLRLENRGLRLDYQLCSPHFDGRILKADFDQSTQHLTDHAPFTVAYDMTDLISMASDEVQIV